MDVSAATTYYLFCKDAAENISTGESKSYYTITIHNMLNAVSAAE
jgi:hypothetical protein